MSLTISIVSHGHLSLVRELLRDLESQSLTVPLEVILTLNIAGEELDRAEYPRLALRLIQNKTPKGFGANHNAAAAQATGEWLIVLNPDIRLEGPESLQRLLLHAADLPAFSICAPRIINQEGAQEDSVRALLTPWSLVRRARGQRHAQDATEPARKGRPFYWFAGMFLLVRQADFLGLDGFDERYFLYCEDFDLCARAVLAGGELHQVRSVSAIHHARRDSHRSRKHLKWHLESLFRVWTSSAFWQLLLSA